MPKQSSSKTNSPDAKTQTAKFRAMARELECDDDDEAFKAKLVKVLKAPKAPKAPKDDKPA